MEQLAIDALPIRLLVLVVGGGAVCWIVISHLMAYMSGWKRAANQFAIDSLDEFPDDAIVYGSAKIGTANYTNSVSIAINSMGIYLRPVLLFRAGHTPLFIPWGAVSQIEKNPTSSYLQKLAQTTGLAGAIISTVGSITREGKLLGDSYKITVGNPSILTIIFSGKVVQRWGAQLASRMDNTLR